MGKPSGKTWIPFPSVPVQIFKNSSVGGNPSTPTLNKSQLHLFIGQKSKLQFSDNVLHKTSSERCWYSFCGIPADETPEEEKPYSFLSLLPNYLVDQEVPLVQGGVNTNRHLRSFVCSCRCARSLRIQAQTCLPNRP